MARRLFLHIGPPKTGTSYLQAAWFQHRSELAEHGLLYPGQVAGEQFQASAVATDKQRVVEQMTPQQAGAWERILGEVAQWPGDALLSSEHYSKAAAPRVGPVLEQLGEVADEVHLVIGARDLARQLTAGWQQQVKHGSPRTFEEFWTDCASKDLGGFWVAQNLPRTIQRWAADLPPDRVHLVILGRPGSPRDQLWNDMCAVTGVDPTILGTVERGNESLDAIQVELLRRMNAALAPDVRRHVPISRLIRSLVVNRFLPDLRTDAKLGLSPEAEAWVVERSRTMVEELREMHPTVIGDVRGDLDDLLSIPSGTQVGRIPDTVSDTEVAHLAPRVLARFLQHELEMRERLDDLQRENRALTRQVKRLRTQQQKAQEEADALASRTLLQRLRQGRSAKN